MVAKKAQSKRKAADTRDEQALKLALKALKGTQHNPINWVAIAQFIGPIVARLAARQAARYVSGRLKKKMTKAMPAETADYVADRMNQILAKLAREIK